VLSNKLERYTKALINTHVDEVDPQAEEEGNSKTALQLIAQDDREVKETISSFRDENFPLVCTFDHFMKVLENTVR
jgi:hypothetical protein